MKTREPRGMWIVACLLTKHEPKCTALSQTVSWNFKCTEQEARRQALDFAHKSKPGFAVEQVITCPIDLPARNAKATRSKRKKKGTQ